MDILYEIYRMEPEDTRFNLYKKRKTFKTGGSGKKITKDTKSYDREISMGYGMPFERCLDAIAKDKLHGIPGSTSIPKWIKRYKEITVTLLYIYRFLLKSQK